MNDKPTFRTFLPRLYITHSDYTNTNFIYIHTYICILNILCTLFFFLLYIYPTSIIQWLVPTEFTELMYIPYVKWHAPHKCEKHDRILSPHLYISNYHHLSINKQYVLFYMYNMHYQDDVGHSHSHI